MKFIEKIFEVMKYNLCDFCLGRNFAQLLTNFSNKERGKAIRNFIAMMLDSKEKLDLNLSNFSKINFRNFKFEKKEEKCYICNNFFDEKIEEYSKKCIKKMKDYEFKSFMIGCKLPSSFLKNEEEIWEKIGIENVESIKYDINREVGKIISKKLKKMHDEKSPELICILDLKNENISLQIRSVYIYGKYLKLVRGIPQSKWICNNCKGKGCLKCKGRGKLYNTSVQEIIEKPLKKISKCKKTVFHGGGREDIDARLLDYREFVIELVKPKVRSIDLKKVEKIINKSKKVKVKKLRFSEK